MKLLFLFSLSIFFHHCKSQQLVSVVKIYDSRIESYIAKNKDTDPEFFNSKKRFWIQNSCYSILGIEGLGIKYIYDFEKKELKRLNGLFDVSKKMKLKYDFTGAIGSNFYFDGSKIGWLTSVANLTSLRVVDVERNSRSEKIFNIPQSLQEIDPIIIDTTCLLLNNFILYENGEIDTLKVGLTTTFPSEGDKIFMRRHAFMIDKYFGQKNPNATATKTNPIDFNKIEGNQLITQKIIAPNINTENYRIECGHSNVWLLSHKSSPEKFFLFDTQSSATYPFELDKNIFKVDSFSLAQPVQSSETAPGRDVMFSYMSSMNEKHIYLYVIKNGITLYRIQNYKNLMSN
jgi:hypothetical protein